MMSHTRMVEPKEAFSRPGPCLNRIPVISFGNKCFVSQTATLLLERIRARLARLFDDPSGDCVWQPWISPAGANTTARETDPWPGLGTQCSAAGPPHQRAPVHRHGDGRAAWILPAAAVSNSHSGPLPGPHPAGRERPPLCHHYWTKDRACAPRITH